MIKPYFWTIEKFPVQCSKVVCRYVCKEVNINILASDVNGTDNFKATVQRREGDISSFFHYYSIWVKLFELREVENPVLKLSEMCQLAEWEAWQFLFSTTAPEKACSRLSSVYGNIHIQSLGTFSTSYLGKEIYCLPPRPTTREVYVLDVFLFPLSLTDIISHGSPAEIPPSKLNSAEKAIQGDRINY